MPNLAQLVSYCTRRTVGLSGTDDIYSALNSAGYYVYTQVLKELSGFFLKEDNTSIVLKPPASSTDVEPQLYTVPADCGQIVWMGERPLTDPSCDWDEMRPVSIGRTVQDLQDNFGNWYSNYWSGDSSPFSYYGPFLPADAAIDVPDVSAEDQIQSIQVSPIVDISRSVLIIYTAKWLTLIDSASQLMMPEEGTYAMQYYAVGELLEGIDDDRASSFNRRGDEHLAAFLTWVRDRQVQTPKRAEPYL